MTDYYLCDAKDILKCNIDNICYLPVYVYDNGLPRLAGGYCINYDFSDRRVSNRRAILVEGLTNKELIILALVGADITKVTIGMFSTYLQDVINGRVNGYDWYTVGNLSGTANE